MAFSLTKEGALQSGEVKLYLPLSPHASQNFSTTFGDRSFRFVVKVYEPRQVCTRARKTAALREHIATIITPVEIACMGYVPTFAVKSPDASVSSTPVSGNRHSFDLISKRTRTVEPTDVVPLNVRVMLIPREGTAITPSKILTDLYRDLQRGTMPIHDVVLVSRDGKHSYANACILSRKVFYFATKQPHPDPERDELSESSESESDSDPEEPYEADPNTCDRILRDYPDSCFALDDNNTDDIFLPIADDGRKFCSVPARLGAEKEAVDLFLYCVYVGPSTDISEASIETIVDIVRIADALGVDNDVQYIISLSIGLRFDIAPEVMSALSHSRLAFVHLRRKVQQALNLDNNLCSTGTKRKLEGA